MEHGVYKRIPYDARSTISPHYRGNPPSTTYVALMPDGEQTSVVPVLSTDRGQYERRDHRSWTIEKSPFSVEDLCRAGVVDSCDAVERVADLSSVLPI